MNKLTSNPIPHSYEPLKQITINRVANGYVIHPTEKAHVNELLVFRDIEDVWDWLKVWAEK